MIAFQGCHCSLQLTQLYKRRRGHVRSVIEKIAIISNAESKTSYPKFIVNAKKIVGLDEPPLWVFDACTLITLQAAFHQQPPPSVWTRVSKYAEGLSMSGMLPPVMEAQPRIQRNARYVLIR